MKITIKNNANSLYEIKKSQFFSYVFSVQSENDIKKILLDLKKQHKEARHICYAYICGNMEKCTDDGEPSGTAGKPLLDLIKNNGYTNLLLVVVRYFGGIKLGAGGLYRAYLTAGKEVLEKCKKVQLVKTTLVKITIPYEKEKESVLILKRIGMNISKIEYLENVVIESFVDDISKLTDLEKLNIKCTYDEIYVAKGDDCGNNN